MNKYVEYFKNLSKTTKIFLTFILGCSALASLNWILGVAVFGTGLVAASIITAVNEAIDS